MNPIERIQALLADGRGINMILTYQSRSGRHRSYRLFALDRNLRTVDITSDICRSIGARWDNTTGTFTSKEPYRSMDAPELAIKLSKALGRMNPVPVVVL